MDVAIKHNGVTITGFVTEYERTHRICTGIGNLTISIVDTIGRTFVPWDSIDIYENGDFKVRYYVSGIEHDIPRGTYNLDCQDNSKRLVDYFIPDSYTVDYPSYTKYWIEKFLTEAGVTYEFQVSGSGNLLSNFTQLGLVTVFEQVQTLLQMSGWYMYFDGNGKAIIGTLTTNLAEDVDSVGKTDILDILVTKDDKMLRNKALVFGAYDPYAGGMSKASVTVHTPWNYDHNDIRTVVISNSAIPDSESAYGMANQIVKEFSRITVEKHITVWGARDFNLGTALRVTSNIWSGRGLVTTFGVSMSKQGLVTKVILDERCPRLFGFFDFGDYVYVATYGDGIWRKHIKFDPTWYNFSTGLTDLAITDLHINNGVFGSVGASGGIFYALQDLPWNPLSLANGLESSTEDNVDPELTYDELDVTTFSGLMARATIVDKTTNYVKFAVDNASGVNYGDYFLDHGGTTVSGITGSGIASSGTIANFSGKRGWIVEYNVMGGDYVGTSYPISLSGCYAYTVLDLDNDGTHDYVSVATSGTGLETNQQYANFGYNVNQPSWDTFDSNNRVAYNLYDDFDEENQSLDGSFTTSLASVGGHHAVFNNEINGDRDIIWYSNVSGVRTMKRVRVNNSGGTLSSTTLTSPSMSYSPSVLAITKVNNDLVRIYTRIFYSLGSGELLNTAIGYIEWDTVNNTISSSVTQIGDSLVVYDDPTQTGSTYERVEATSDVSVNKITILAVHFLSADYGSFYNTTNLKNRIELHILTCEFGSLSPNYQVTTVYFNERDVSGPDGHRWNIEYLYGGNINIAKMYQLGENTAWHLFIREIEETGLYGTRLTTQNWMVYSHDMVTFNAVLVETSVAGEGTIGEGGATWYPVWVQTTQDTYLFHIINIKATSVSYGRGYVYNGTTVSIVSGAAPISFNWVAANIFPMFGEHAYSYIAYNPSTDAWYWCNPYTLAVESQIEFPTGYTPNFPFSTTQTYSQVYYWHCTNDDTSNDEILRFSSTGYMGSSIKPFDSNLDQGKGQIFGNFFVSYNGGATTRWLYIDNPEPDGEIIIYQILQRTENEFKLIQQETYPLRVDISNYSPVLTVGSGEATFQSNYVYDTELVTITPVPSGVSITASGNQVNDYRYVFIEPMAGEFPIGSGLGVQTTALYISSGIIYGADTLTYSGGFQVMYTVPSGYNGTRIETSNYGYGGQYIFITAAGVTQEFFQSDPGMQGVFTMYSGLPQSRATIIRLDDIL